MATSTECPPHPGSLLESLRNLGYSLGAAIADLVDNSITAAASKIEIYHDVDQSPPRIAIVDNGKGMEQHVLTKAMRMGSSSPLECRSVDDLGRFGLGMKTASFSQARRLTVVSLKDGVWAGARWDLDKLDERWNLDILDGDEIASTPWIQAIPESGTLVLWEKLDRLGGKQVKLVTPKVLFREMESARDHLALVFHRYLEDNSFSHLSISINNYPVESYDPFFKRHRATQSLNGLAVKIDSDKAEIKPYIIPHYSKLSGSERDLLKKYGGQSKTQGFYVYRNRRLLAWGSWFGLRRQKREASSLARIQVDISNAMDHLWGIDVMKSKAVFPEIVKDEMKLVLDRIEHSSVRTYTSRGQKLSEAYPYPLWQREIRSDGVRYLIDHDHPLLKAFAEKLNDDDSSILKSLLSLLEKCVPIEAIYNDRLGDNLDCSSHEDDEREEKYQQMLRLLLESGHGREQSEKILEHIFKN